MGNEVATTSRGFSLVPGSFDEAIKYATYLSKSDLVPKDYKDKPQNIVVAMAWGQDLGLQPLQALQNIAVINGRPSVWGDAALAVVMSHPDFEDIEEIIETGAGPNGPKDEDKYRAVCKIKRRGRTETVRTFSVEDAKRSGLWGKQGPWQNTPKRMLQMRARGFAMRDAFPDALRGIRLAEEEGDIIDVSPAGDVLPRTVQMPQAKPQAKPKDVQAEVVVDVKQEAAPAAEATGDRPNGAVISAGQVKVIRAKLAAAGVDEGELADKFGVFAIEDIPALKCNEALAWVRAAEAKAAQQ